MHRRRRPAASARIRSAVQKACRHRTGSVPRRHANTGGPLLLYLQGAGLSGPATDAAGASKISNDEFSLFVQDQWQPTTRLTLNYGCGGTRRPCPKPSTRGRPLAGLPRRSALSLGWNDSRSVGHVSASVRLAWDLKGDGRCLREQRGVYAARQNMLSQVGSVTTNGVQQQTLYVDTGLLRTFGAPTPTWPGVLMPRLHLGRVSALQRRACIPS